MKPLKTTTITFRLTPDMRAALALIQQRDGVPMAEQIRRGILMWMSERAVVPQRKMARA